MFHFRRIYVIIFACLLLSSMALPTYAQGGSEGRNPVFEQGILDRLAAINPEAVSFFQAATQAMDAEEYETAKTQYEQVLTLAPDFPDALRRLSYCELSLKLTDAALKHAQRAFDLDPSSYNKIGLANVLVEIGSPASETKALNLAKEAVVDLPNDPYAYSILMFAAASREDIESLRTACEALIRLAPEYDVPHYYDGLLAAQDGEWEKAEAEMLKAQALGAPKEEIQRVLAETGIATHARIYRSMRWGGYGVAVWLGGMAILFLVGGLLSWITIATVKHTPASPKAEPSSSERLVRGIYRAIIVLTSLYFYVSIPFVILIVLVGTLAIFYLFFTSGHLPIQLMLIIGLSAIYTLFAMVRSLFARVKPQEPGRLLKPEEAPALWRLTEEVAQKLGTRPIEAIYITPGTEIGVVERGGFWKKATGKSQRALLLGLGVLSGMKQGQFKSILAHEYGHFTAKDTAGGELARQVQISIQHLAYNLSASGQATVYNPGWWFVSGFYRIFLRVTHGASRLQEILADRYAAIAFGARNFTEGLEHIIRKSVAFKFVADNEINQALQRGERIHNLYTLPSPEIGEDQRMLTAAMDEALNRPTTVYDTHPSPRERFNMVQALHLPDRWEGWEDENPILDLLPNSAGLQEEMTVVVQGRVTGQVRRR
jgi:Zn-dependent protease with chaperone function